VYVGGIGNESRDPLQADVRPVVEVGDERKRRKRWDGGSCLYLRLRVLERDLGCNRSTKTTRARPWVMLLLTAVPREIEIIFQGTTCF
jgi:hypothetical protein